MVGSYRKLQDPSPSPSGSTASGSTSSGSMKDSSGFAEEDINDLPCEVRFTLK